VTDRTSHLVVGDAAGVRSITLDRPEAKNALSRAMRSELCGLLASADRDPDVCVVVLGAVDPAFCAGVDFKERDESFDPYAARFTANPGRALRAMTTPVICAVNGACVSGGLEIALSSSFVVASDRASFADTHALLDAVPTWGLTALLPRAVGIRKAREMSITGCFVGAEEAHRLGLVNHVVDHEALGPFALELAGRVAGTSAVGEVLRLYDRGEDLPMSAALALEASETAGRAFDAEAFENAGRAVARRDRG